MLSINTNLSSLIAQNSLTTSTNKLNQAIERMTTGFKINHAKDNAANYSISTNMSTKIGAYDIAADNVAMGMDLVTTASDMIATMQDHAHRLQALSIQARNGTYGQQSIDAINSEASAIMTEINRLYSTAEYNGVVLFTGSTETTPKVATFAMLRAVSSEGYFIEDPISYTDEEVEAMTTMTQAVAESLLVSGGIYSISTVDELVALADYVNSGNDTTDMTFVLGADIDLSSISNWTPIGDYSTATSYQFKGTFDGNGQLIKNLTIDNETKDRQGLFGRASSASKIKNVGLEDENIKGKSYVGGLVGETYGSISNSYTTGMVKGAGRVGGLAGLSSSTSVINNSYANGDVTGTSNYVGGLVGEALGSISNSYTTGMVKGVGRVGGLAGLSSSTSVINNSYANGDVTGTSNYVGGLVGEALGSISNSYSTGNVTGTSGATSVSNSTDWYGVSFTYDYQTAGYSGNNGSIISNGNAIGVTSFMLQVGINSDSSCQIGFDTNFAFDLSEVEFDISSDEALASITDFINLLSEKSTQLGAVQNRLDSALDSIEVSVENLTSSRTTIRDADIAEVSSEYIRQQILQQASATLMSTANQSPAIALQLI